MNPYIYLRALRRVEHSVFCVQDGQKFYYDPQFNTRVPYSSGQQVKRSVLESVADALDTTISPTTFTFNVGKNKDLGEGEAWAACDPTYVDQLLGGWMKAQSGGGNRTIKRRSPLSISAMRPVHPLLGGIHKENLTFDRSDKPHLHKIIVRDSSGKELSEDDVVAFLDGTDRSLTRKWIPDNARATGLFVYDIAIDLRTLFCVSLNQYEPELNPEIIEKLKANGWVESENAFGPCLVCPSEDRERIIPALAKALVNWRITSNQARTFSLMETLAVAVSDNANRLAGAIRAKLVEDSEKPKAKPIVEEVPGVELFVTLPCAGYIVTTNESVDALDMAEASLIERMMAFDYENQAQPVEVA